MFLKTLENGNLQLLVRATNALKTILLNVLLTEKLPLSQHGKQSVRLLCAQPGEDNQSTKLIEYFFKCDTPQEAKELCERLEKERSKAAKS